MLGKLMKYEMKASWRNFIPLYLGTLMIAVISSFSLGRGLRLLEEASSLTGIVFSISLLVIFAACVAIIVLTGMTIVQRFGISLLGKEGYLVFTLPVTETQLLWSKLLAACIWSISSVFVMGVAGMLIGGVLISHGVYSGELSGLFRQVDGVWLLLNAFDGVISLISLILGIYLALMIGQTEQFSKWRVIASLIVFFIIQFVFGTIDSGLSWVMGYTDPDVYAYVTNISAYYGRVGYNCIFNLAQAAICFIATVWLMRKKLNL